MRQNSFTLIELVIVISILAILAAVIVIVINPAEYVKSARDSVRMSDIQTIHSSNKDKTSKDGGSYTGLYELGSNLTLLPLDYGETSLNDVHV